MYLVDYLGYVHIRYTSIIHSLYIHTWNCPLGHAPHLTELNVLLTPVALENLPGAHAMHTAVAATGATRPMGHAVHEVRRE
jgi:hypothetical protein